MSGTDEGLRVQDTRNAQSKLVLSCTNWELITVTAVLTLFLGLFVVYCSKEQCPYKCSSDLDWALKVTEKLLNLEKKVEELKEIEEALKPVQSTTVFFEVKLPEKHTYAAGDRVIFTHHVYDAKKVYDTVFGYFQPPLNGTYFFSVSLSNALQMMRG